MVVVGVVRHDGIEHGRIWDGDRVAIHHRLEPIALGSTRLDPGLEEEVLPIPSVVASAGESRIPAPPADPGSAERTSGRTRVSLPASPPTTPDMGWSFSAGLEDHAPTRRAGVPPPTAGAPPRRGTPLHPARAQTDPPLRRRTAGHRNRLRRAYRERGPPGHDLTSAVSWEALPKEPSPGPLGPTEHVHVQVGRTHGGWRARGSRAQRPTTPAAPLSHWPGEHPPFRSFTDEGVSPLTLRATTVSGQGPSACTRNPTSSQRTTRIALRH